MRDMTEYEYKYAHRLPAAVHLSRTHEAAARHKNSIRRFAADAENHAMRAEALRAPSAGQAPEQAGEPAAGANSAVPGIAQLRRSGVLREHGGDVVGIHVHQNGHNVILLGTICQRFPLAGIY